MFPLDTIASPHYRLSVVVVRVRHWWCRFAKDTKHMSHASHHVTGLSSLEHTPTYTNLSIHLLNIYFLFAPPPSCSHIWPNGNFFQLCVSCLFPSIFFYYISTIHMAGDLLSVTTNTQWKYSLACYFSQKIYISHTWESILLLVKSKSFTVVFIDYSHRLLAYQPVLDYSPACCLYAVVYIKDVLEEIFAILEHIRIKYHRLWFITKLKHLSLPLSVMISLLNFFT